ncbi:MAG: septum formation initiator family protein, partial [Coriobacteriales bacterium]|nr:septum formation initiator family protein [Coriobacteriales bacterium]
ATNAAKHATATSRLASRPAPPKEKSAKLGASSNLKVVPRRVTGSIGTAGGSSSALLASQAERRHPVLVGLLVAAAVVLCLAAAVVLLYPVSKEYYIAMRQTDRLTAEYDAVLERNERIQEQIDALQTPEGIEDRVREQFGWVKRGELAVNITGLSLSNTSTVLPDAVLSGSVEPESDWLINMLDHFFGVDTPEVAKPPVHDLLEP